MPSFAKYLVGYSKYQTPDEIEVFEKVFNTKINAGIWYFI